MWINPISSFFSICSAYDKSLIHALLAILKTYIVAKIYYIVIMFIYKKIWRARQQAKYLKIAKLKKATVDKSNLVQYQKSKGNYKQIVEVEETELLKADISQLHQWMLEGKFTPTMLHDFYTIRCFEIGCRLNLVAEIIYDYSRQFSV